MAAAAGAAAAGGLGAGLDHHDMLIPAHHEMLIPAYLLFGGFGHHGYSEMGHYGMGHGIGVGGAAGGGAVAAAGAAGGGTGFGGESKDFQCFLEVTKSLLYRKITAHIIYL
ncbi:hypothetical protein AVEN_138636-2 [Araneus ventricosus]|uniref:Uncharacterized protein n=1 Tax=Araneus ventricosus TaxID=182803 RepID=A0A4Y2E3Y0_ARAVE|nr:hypothetical protein AVEN_138636-2 [Araneus ventricosus]